MLLRIVSIIFPIFAIVGVGYAYARVKKPDMSFANQLNMDVFVPALVFAALAGKDFDLMANWKLALGATAVVLGSGLLAWPVAKLMKVPANTLLPPMMFNNSGNMGLPLLVLAFGEQALPLAVVLFFVENTLHYALGTWMLDHHAKLWNLWRVPVIAAAIAGLAVSLLKIELWSPLYVGIKMLGDVSIPLLLFSLGVRLTDSAAKDLRLGLVGAALCPLAGMAVAWAMVPVLGLEGMQAGMLLIFGALPPAVLNYIFAEKYKQEPERVASIVMIGNVASLGFVPLALFFALPR
ncbi:AEC family transporter [Azospira restricta]|uniref:AEC family transporter n=1 Tax=Azospira restricta TaxID=404405 RepID=A0A974SR04_9RHOO|nr:AEC family transporter [Azospira restricta]QRJ64839.1 AEC family transporter [Azospira restricta]